MSPQRTGRAEALTGTLQQSTRYYLAHAFLALRIAIGLIYIWFGVLKFVSGASPAVALATTTMSALTFGTVPAAVSRPLLALFETVIGLLFLSGRLRRLTTVAFVAHVLGAMSSLLLATDLVWRHVPFEPTLAGQYVLKDVVLLTAGLLVLTVPAYVPEERAERRAAVAAERLTLPEPPLVAGAPTPPIPAAPAPPMLPEFPEPPEPEPLPGI